MVLPEDYVKTWVIDASPLFKCVLANMWEKGELEGRESFDKIVRSEFIFDGGFEVEMIRFYLTILGRFRNVSTSAHVIGVMVGLGFKFNPLHRKTYWRSLCEMVTKFRMDEKWIGLLEVHNHRNFGVHLPDFGVSDLSTIELALQHNGILLTNDRRAPTTLSTKKLIRYYVADELFLQI